MSTRKMLELLLLFASVHITRIVFILAFEAVLNDIPTIESAPRDRRVAPLDTKAAESAAELFGAAPYVHSCGSVWPHLRAGMWHVLADSIEMSDVHNLYPPWATVPVFARLSYTLAARDSLVCLL
jgi:hypothetical protein